jgi:RNA-directed DNA polymerase
VETTLAQRISVGLGIPARDILTLARSAPHRYKVYVVPKRSGRGVRLLAQPAKEVKLVQRWLVENELQRLPVHLAATAYQPGTSIVKNATAHVEHRYLLKLDFKNFFPSIKGLHLRAHIGKYCPDIFTPDDIALICRMTLWYPPKLRELQLCVGAPSSPFISNTIMFGFDETVQSHCDPLQVTYTRYADDLTFSTNTPHLFRTLAKTVRKFLRSLEYPNIYLNQTKTVHTSKKHFRRVTGLVLASQGYVSLGRERKRSISAMVHHFTLGKLEDEACSKLRGLIAFAEDAEPLFVRRLEQKYGYDWILKIKQHGIKKRAKPPAE